MSSELKITFTPHQSHSQKMTLEQAARWLAAFAKEGQPFTYVEQQTSPDDSTPRIGWYVTVE